MDYNYYPSGEQGTITHLRHNHSRQTVYRVLSHVAISKVKLFFRFTRLQELETMAAKTSSPNCDASSIIRGHEGTRKCVYVDTTGHHTIGVGYNLDQAGARAMITSVGADFDKVIISYKALVHLFYMNTYVIDILRRRLLDLRTDRYNICIYCPSS